MVLKSVVLPTTPRSEFCWRRHNTKLIRRRAPGVSVDLKGGRLGDFRVALSLPLQTISKWPQHLAKFLHFPYLLTLAHLMVQENDMRCKNKKDNNNVDSVTPALLGDVICPVYSPLSSSPSCPSPSTPPVPFYQSLVGTVSQSGQACPLLWPCTG